MAQNECFAKEDPSGNCLVGDGNNPADEYLCGLTCGQKSSTGCADCLNYDLTGDSGGKSDCVWRVKAGNEEPDCVHREWCDESGNKDGKCIGGRKNRTQKNRCRVGPSDFCPGLKSCGRCLSGKFGKECAWKIDGENPSCVAEDRCEGDCINGSETLSVKKTCRKLKRSPIGVGFETCSDFDKLCTDCLTNGCSWVRDTNECVDSCDVAPADAGCQGLPLESQQTIDSFNRSLLRFDRKASQMCYKFKLEDKNERLCSKAGNGGCERCVATKIYTPPGTIFLSPPTCKYFPEGGFCAPYNCGLMGCGRDTCDDRLKLVEDDDSVGPALPPPDTTWPELVGETGEYGIEYLNDCYGKGTLFIQVVGEGDMVTKDYRLDRVRLFVNKSSDYIIRVPGIG